MDRTSLLPEMYLCRQPLKKSGVRDVAGEVGRTLSAPGLRDYLKDAGSVGVCVGSRGIDAISEIVSVVVRTLRGWGKRCVLIPAMGSHGGATAEGQRAVLQSLGITEKACGAPVLSGMDVVDAGPTPEGYHAFLDRNAAACDALLLVNRIKDHTDFVGETESGILKMAAIGLGNHRGAAYIHSHGLIGLRTCIPAIAGRLIAAHRIAGLAILEDGYGRFDGLHVLLGDEIPAREAALLAVARQNKAKIPFRRLDCLMIGETGKNISGAGVDSKVIGRIRYHGVPEPEGPNPSIVCALRLTPQSHGNAAGMGLLDLVSGRYAEAVDMEATRVNGLTTKCPERYKMPLVLGTDRETLQTAAEFAMACHDYEEKYMLIQNTERLERFCISRALLPEALPLGVEVLRRAPWRFDGAGLLEDPFWKEMGESACW